MSPRAINKKEEKEVCEKYNSGITATVIADEYDTCVVTVCNYLEKNNIETNHKNKYNFNENVFSEINNKSAYWIGFILADGCIRDRSKRSDRLQLKLSLKDKDHLQRFKKFLKSNHEIYERYTNRGNLCVIRISSQKLVNQLSKYGIEPRKTLNENIKNDKLIKNRHFWRGMVDGDGSVMIYSNLPRLKLVGSIMVIEKFKNYCTSLCNSNASIRKRDKIYSYTISSKKYTTKVISKLYKNCDTYLDRKKETADKIIRKYS